MKISLQNIAAIKKANIEIDGIAVIAGPNNTGKSTVSKALFSVFNSFYNIKSKVKNDKIETIEGLLDNMIDESDERFEDFYRNSRDIAIEIVETLSEKHIDDKKIYDIIEGFEDSFDFLMGEINYHEHVNDIIDIIKMPYGSIVSRVLTKKLNDEFEGQINNVFDNKVGLILLTIKDETAKINILDDMAKQKNDFFDLKTELVYLDDPFLLDNYDLARMSFLRRRDRGNHRDYLAFKFFNNNVYENEVKEIKKEEKFKEIYDFLNLVCDGDFVNMKNRLYYKKANSKKMIKLRNLSSGLKTFIMIKQLFVNGTIEKNGTIILDEPEIHLHPEWQLVFAELIVLLQKTFNLHILLTTHSPYFLRAIQVYAAKHEIADKCTYYLSRLEGNDAYIDDVSNDIEKIYSSLARPFQTLENEKWRLYE